MSRASGAKNRRSVGMAGRKARDAARLQREGKWQPFGTLSWMGSNANEADVQAACLGQTIMDEFDAAKLCEVWRSTSTLGGGYCLDRALRTHLGITRQELEERILAIDPDLPWSSALVHRFPQGRVPDQRHARRQASPRGLPNLLRHRQPRNLPEARRNRPRAESSFERSGTKSEKWGVRAGGSG